VRPLVEALGSRVSGALEASEVLAAPPRLGALRVLSLPALLLRVSLRERSLP